MMIELARGDNRITIDCPDTTYTPRHLTRWINEANRALDDVEARVPRRNPQAAEEVTRT